MKKIMILGLLLAPLCAGVLYASYASSARRAVAFAAQSPQARAEASFDAFVGQGMPVTVTGLTAVKHLTAQGTGELLSQLQFKVAGKGIINARSVNLSLFEFDANGGLLSVEGWVRNINLTDSRGNTDLTLDVNRVLTPDKRFVLTVDRVHGEAQTYESPYLELTQATKKAGAGDPKADARVDRVDYSLPELAGGALCSYAQSRAMQLTQAGDRAGYSAFTCDQYERSYFIRFNSKQL